MGAQIPPAGEPGDREEGGDPEEEQRQLPAGESEEHATILTSPPD
jgi:hypothetical protein